MKKVCVKGNYLLCFFQEKDVGRRDKWMSLLSLQNRLIECYVMMALN